MSKGRKIIAKLRNKYRLVLINDSSFAEVFSIRLTPLNLLMLLSTIFLIFTFIIFSLISYTPVRQLVPGYGKASDNAAWLELNQKVEDLNRKFESRAMKENALNKILSESEDQLDSSKQSQK